MKAIIVCVDYGDLLAKTLRHALPHFERIVVVTSPEDHRTEQVVCQVANSPNVAILSTDAFYRHGAAFNKGLALEEGFDVLGRDGWLCTLDADIVLPPEMPLAEMTPGNMYVPYRRMCRDPSTFGGQTDWSRWPHSLEKRTNEFAGYCCFFHADDPALGEPPWYPIDRNNASVDSFFIYETWPAERRVRLDFDVLHLGDHEGSVHHWGMRPEGLARRQRDLAERMRIGDWRKFDHERVLKVPK
jgi:hypothetical protein